MGALPELAGSGVNAEIAIWRGLAALTAMLGSLSWLVSPLKVCGTMLTTRIGIYLPSFLDGLRGKDQGVNPGHGAGSMEVERVERRKDPTLGRRSLLVVVLAFVG